MNLKLRLDKSKFVEQGPQLSFSSNEESILDISRLQEEKDVFSRNQLLFLRGFDLLPLLSNSRSQYPQEWNLVSIFHFDIKPSPFRTFGQSSPSASPGRYTLGISSSFLSIVIIRSFGSFPSPHCWKTHTTHFYSPKMFEAIIVLSLSLFSNLFPVIASGILHYIVRPYLYPK